MNLEDILDDPDAKEELRKGRKERHGVTPDEYRRNLFENLVAVYTEYAKQGHSSQTREEAYEKAVRVTKKLVAVPSPEIVAKLFSCPELRHDRGGLGLFLSALMNTSLGKDDVVTLRQVDEYDSNLGAFLGKGKLVIEGSVYSVATPKLGGGTVVVKGDTKYGYCDGMEDGKVILEGFVRGDGCMNVKGGRVIIHKIDEHGTFSRGFCREQEGGLIEILCDVPSIVNHLCGGIGYLQRGGDLIVHGNVHCDVGTNAERGSIRIDRDVKGPNVQVGWWLRGADIQIDGSVCGEACGHDQRAEALVAFMARSGTIRIAKDVRGSIVQQASSDVRVHVGGDVHGRIGEFDTAGSLVEVGGSVYGSVGALPGRIWPDKTPPVRCKVKGKVVGNVGDGEIEIDGDVHGNINGLVTPSRVHVHGSVDGVVGEGMDGAEVLVDGTIREVGESYSGRVVEGGRGVTRIPLRKKMVKRFVDWANRH